MRLPQIPGGVANRKTPLPDEVAISGTLVIVWEDDQIKAIPPEQWSHLERLPEQTSKEPVVVPRSPQQMTVIGAPLGRRFEVCGSGWPW